MSKTTTNKKEKEEVMIEDIHALNQIINQCNIMLHNINKQVIKNNKENLTTKVESNSLNLLNQFISTKESQVNEMIVINQALDTYKVQRKIYIDEICKKTYKSGEWTFEEKNTYFNLISRLVDAYGKCLNNTKKAFTNSIIEKLNDMKKTGTFLNCTVSKEQQEQLLLLVRNSSKKGYNLNFLYNDITLLAIKNNDYPTNKISIKFEKGLKEVKKVDCLEGLTLDKACDLLKELSIKSYKEVTSRKNWDYKDIMKALFRLSKYMLVLTKKEKDLLKSKNITL